MKRIGTMFKRGRPIHMMQGMYGNNRVAIQLDTPDGERFGVLTVIRAPALAMNENTHLEAA